MTCIMFFTLSEVTETSLIIEWIFWSKKWHLWKNKIQIYGNECTSYSSSFWSHSVVKHKAPFKYHHNNNNNKPIYFPILHPNTNELNVNGCCQSFFGSEEKLKDLWFNMQIRIRRCRSQKVKVIYFNEKTF